MSNPKTADPVKLTKDEVLGRWAEGIYAAYPEQYVPDALGYVLDDWQKMTIRKLLIGSNAPEDADIYSWFPEKKARLSVRACHSAGKCTAFGETLQLSNGSLVKVEDLIGKTFRTASVNEKFEVVHTEAFAADNGTRPVWKITTSDGREIIRTGNHPMWHIQCQFQNARRPKFGEQGWKTVKELKVGDLICASEFLPTEADNPMEEWQVKILGHLIGDGCFRASGVSYSQSDGPALNEVRSIVESLGLRLEEGGKCSYRISGERFKPINEILTLTKDLDIHGRGSGEQKFPDRIWKIPNRQMAVFLSRLFSADGWTCSGESLDKRTGKNSRFQEIGFVSKSERLVRDVHLACLRFGIAGKINSTRKSWTYKGIKKTGTYWIWNIYDSRNVIKFIEQIGIFGKEAACQKTKEVAMREFSPGKNAIPSRHVQPWGEKEKRAYKWPFYRLPNGFRWEKIQLIEYLGELPTVAICVPETHTYLSLFYEHNSFIAGILTHLFLGLYVPSKVAITGITGKQTSKQIWPYIYTTWTRSVFKDDIDMFGTTMKYKDSPGEWFATWVTSKEPKSIEGFHGPDEGKNLLWIVEEAKGPEDAVFEAIQGALSNEHNYWFISSTCGTASGFFFDTFHSKQSLWENVKVTYKDSSRISLDQVKKWEETWGRESSIFQARVMAEFPSEDDKILVPLSWCERAIRQPQREGEFDEAA